MKLPRFGVEEWLNVHEKSAIYDIAGVSIKALTLEELFDLSDIDKDTFFNQLLRKKMDYGWIEGSPEFRLRCQVCTRICKLIISSKPMGLQVRLCLPSML